MKKLNLIVLSVAALAFGRPAGLCTANAAAKADDKPKEPSVEDRLAALEAENVELKKQLDLPRVLDPEPPDGPLAMLCKGAGVDIADVRWRMHAGLDGEQAVEAAIFQRDSDKKAAEAKKAAKK